MKNQSELLSDRMREMNDRKRKGGKEREIYGCEEKRRIRERGILDHD